MADYGLKYLCKYRSKMRGRILYRIEIEQADAVAATDDTALRIRPYSDVFSIKWGNADDAEKAEKAEKPRRAPRRKTAEKAADAVAAEAPKAE